MKFLRKFEDAEKIFKPGLSYMDTVNVDEEGNRLKPIVSYEDRDCRAFGYNEYGEMMVGKSNLVYHSNFPDIYDRMDLTYPGRVWLDSKYIAFWMHPPKEELEKLLSDLKKSLSENGDVVNWDDDWKLEIVDDYRYVDGDYYKRTWDYNTKIIPLSQYGETDMENISENTEYANKMTKIAEEELNKNRGGDDYFDQIDAALKLPKNLDIIKSIFLQIQKEQGTHFNLILTGGFGDWVMSLIKKGVLKVPGNLVTTNGTLRGKGTSLDQTKKGKDVDIVHKKHDISNQKFILFDDSYYSGSTKKSLEDYLKKQQSEIYKTYVLYEGNNKTDADRSSLYRYYDYHNGTPLGVDMLIDYLYSIDADIPKDEVKDKILKGSIKTINDVRNDVSLILKRFGKEPLKINTHKQNKKILKSFENFEYEEDLIFVEGETIDL